MNSILCTRCKKLIHNKCSGVADALKDNLGFVCTQCTDGTVVKSVVKKEMELIGLGQMGKFVIVERLYYLGDMIESGRAAEEASRTRVEYIQRAVIYPASGIISET